MPIFFSKLADLVQYKIAVLSKKINKLGAVQLIHNKFWKHWSEVSQNKKLQRNATFAIVEVALCPFFVSWGLHASACRTFVFVCEFRLMRIGLLKTNKWLNLES